MSNLEITKSLMIHIYLILGNEPNRNSTFSSIRELYNKIEARLEPYNKDEKANYFGKEILKTFDKNMEWMRARGILSFNSKDKMAEKGDVIIDKEKLVQYIIDPELPSPK